MGDDPVSDNEIVDPHGSGVVAPDGTFNFTGNAIGENLDEDWGKDEIYAVVSIVGMGTTFDYESNRVSGYFWDPIAPADWERLAAVNKIIAAQIIVVYLFISRTEEIQV